MIAAQPAMAYSPEAVLAKSMSSVPQLEDATSHQHLNPFSKVELGYDRDYSTGHGAITRDEKGRTRTREEKSWADELSLQLRPKLFREASTYNQLEKALHENTLLTQKTLKSKAAQAAYDLLIRAALAKEQKRLVADWNVVLDKSQQLSSLAAHLSDKDARGVFKSVNEVTKAKNEIIETNAVIAGVTRSLDRTGLNLEGLEISEIISPAEIADRLTQLSQEEGSLSQDRLKSDLATARASLEHSVAERGRLVDALKFSVKKGQDDILRNRFTPGVADPWLQVETRRNTSFSFGISINLPFLAASDLGDQKDKIKLALLADTTIRETQEAEEKKAGLQSMLKEKIALFETLSEKSMKMAEDLRQSDPSLALEMGRDVMSRRMLKAKLQAEIRALYVELLFETGRLAAEPEINHLSRNRKKI